FNRDLNSLLPASLGIALQVSAAKVLRTHKKDTVSNIPVQIGKKKLNVNLTVAPIPNKNGSEALLMLLLKESEKPVDSDTAFFDGQTYLDQYTKDLELEVRLLKNKHDILVEQLDASNENMQSFNEELVSANEEMQSTNEEMQSVNEELHTINSDYHLKNRELMELNDDLNNYFRSNVNGQLFINGEMQLMKFSPAAVELMNLRESDIGRPINHIATNIKFHSILPDIKEVMKNGNIVSQEIQTTEGKWYQMMIMPYLHQQSAQPDGAIITFGDITALKDVQLELDRKNKSLLRINEDLDNFINTASHDLLAPLGNIETSIDVMNQIALSDKKLIDILNLINRSIKTYRQLITDISVIAKVESESSLMELVNIEELIENIEWSLQDKIQQSGAKIKCSLAIKEIKFSKKKPSEHTF
ncbi:MAG: chemotaxis protein CheR, partial [Flavobacterium sp.]